MNYQRGHTNTGRVISNHFAQSSSGVKLIFNNVLKNVNFLISQLTKNCDFFLDYVVYQLQVGKIDHTAFVVQDIYLDSETSLK